MAVNIERLKNITPKVMDFQISKLGCGVLQVADLKRSTEFYTQFLGFNRVAGQDAHLPR